MLTIHLPGRDVPGRIPRHLRWRIALVHAASQSHGYQDGDQPGMPSGEPDGWAAAAVACAAVGLCWAGERTTWPSLTACRGDILEYGEGVLDELYAGTPGAARAIYSEGMRLIGLVVETLPTVEQVEEAADPFGGPAVAGTGGSPASG